MTQYYREHSKVWVSVDCIVFGFENNQLKLLIGRFAKYNANDKQFIFRNGATLQLAYCDNDNDADHFQGIEYDEIFIEEATQLEPKWITDIATSCRGVNNFPHRVFYTCNPGGPGHALIKRLFVERLRTAYHARVSYPSDVKQDTAGSGSDDASSSEAEAN